MAVELSSAHDRTKHQLLVAVAAKAALADRLASSEAEVSRLSDVAAAAQGIAAEKEASVKAVQVNL